MAAPRLVIPDFLSVEQCKEFEFIHKSYNVVGYRPYVLSTTLSHLIATNCAEMIIPFIPVRESLKEVVEGHFGCEFELFVEFTGMISWTRGARIGWHSDNNRPYLKQRHYSAVCYLNTCGQDFEGGLFHFQQGEPLTVVPSLGTVVIYSADEQNIHCVDEVQSGERCTLAMWFTRDYLHNEDTRLIRQLSEAFMHSNIIQLEGTRIDLVSQDFHHQLQSCNTLQTFGENKKLLLPKVASSPMYSFVCKDDSELEAAEEEIKSTHLTTDLLEIRNSRNVCELRLACLGFSRCEEIDYSAATSSAIAKMPLDRKEELTCSSYLEGVKLPLNELTSLSDLDSPMMLHFEEDHIPYVFASWLHALSVVQYFWWKKSTDKVSNNASSDTLKRCFGCEEDELGEVNAQPAKKSRNGCTSFGRNYQRNKVAGTGNLEAERIFHQKYADMITFNKYEFFRIIQQWEEYMLDLWRTLLSSFPCWKTSAAIFSVIAQGSFSNTNTDCHVDELSQG